jgi:hypothetical protein
MEFSFHPVYPYLEVSDRNLPRSQFEEFTASISRKCT